MALLPIDDNLSEFGDLVSVELAQQLFDNINHLFDAMPVGTILPILYGLPGVPMPDTTIWKECDGTLIEDPLSPLRNTLTPDYVTQGVYMRCYGTIGNVGNFGGSNTKNLTHSHGGSTGSNPSMESNADTDNDFWTGKNHTHPIFDDLGTYSFEPIHIRIKHYIKVRDTNEALGGKFKTLEKDFGTSIAQALWLKAARSVNALDKCYPVGAVLFMFNAQDNLPAQPDPAYWQLMDGGTVINPNSPLLTQVLPNVDNLFIRHPKTSEVVFSVAGSNTINLGHNHSGETGYSNDRNDFQMDGGGERAEAENHRHTISSDLGATLDIIPLYTQVQCYVRIV